MDIPAATDTKKPEVNNCRTMPVVPELYECLSDAGKQCSFAQSFGNNFFCLHPSCKDFVALK